MDGIVLISRDLYDEILNVLQGASFCDHDDVRPLIKKLENLEESSIIVHSVAILGCKVKGDTLQCQTHQCQTDLDQKF